MAAPAPPHAAVGQRAARAFVMSARKLSRLVSPILTSPTMDRGAGPSDEQALLRPAGPAEVLRPLAGLPVPPLAMHGCSERGGAPRRLSLAGRPPAAAPPAHHVRRHAGSDCLPHQARIPAVMDRELAPADTESGSVYGVEVDGGTRLHSRLCRWGPAGRARAAPTAAAECCAASSVRLALPPAWVAARCHCRRCAVAALTAAPGHVPPRLRPPCLAGRAVDLASQLVLSVAERKVAQFHPAFPVGRGKLEALAVIACACIMSIASLEVAQFSAMDLYAGFAKGARALAGNERQQAEQAVGTAGDQLAACVANSRPAPPRRRRRRRRAGAGARAAHVWHPCGRYRCQTGTVCVLQRLQGILRLHGRPGRRCERRRWAWRVVRLAAVPRGQAAALGCHSCLTAALLPLHPTTAPE